MDTRYGHTHETKAKLKKWGGMAQDFLQLFIFDFAQRSIDDARSVIITTMVVHKCSRLWNTE